MKHTLRLTLPKLCLGIFLGSLFVVGSTSTITQAFASTTSYQEDGDAEDDDEKEKKPKKKVNVPEAAEPTGEEGVGAGDSCIGIKGKDIDGESFKLSDYEGKVIMLDFWGDW